MAVLYGVRVVRARPMYVCVSRYTSCCRAAGVGASVRPSVLGGGGPPLAVHLLSAVCC